ncbi:MAG: SRPBCC family protein [Nevskia sp.]|nr:SRPBCC family protein [Nevskia sp.]
MPRFLLPALLLAAGPAAAATVETLGVSRQEQRYEVDLRARLDVPAPAAYAAFADPARLPQINPAVQRVQVIGRNADGGLRLFTEVRVCVAWYCRSLRQVQDMRYAPLPDGGSMNAVVLPLQGDFRAGHAEWEFRAADAGTRLHFHAELEPAFWIPPVLGPWLVERSLRREAESTSAGIERAARTLAP